MTKCGLAGGNTKRDDVPRLMRLSVRVCEERKAKVSVKLVRRAWKRKNESGKERTSRKKQEEDESAEMPPV